MVTDNYKIFPSKINPSPFLIGDFISFQYKDHEEEISNIIITL